MFLKHNSTGRHKEVKKKLGTFTCSRWIDKSNGFDGVDLSIHTEQN